MSDIIKKLKNFTAVITRNKTADTTPPEHHPDTLHHLGEVYYNDTQKQWCYIYGSECKDNPVQKTSHNVVIKD